MLVHKFSGKSRIFRMICGNINKLRELLFQLFIKIFITLEIFPAPIFIADLNIF